MKNSHLWLTIRLCKAEVKTEAELSVADGGLKACGNTDSQSAKTGTVTGLRHLRKSLLNI